eukprot:5605418-Pleurochrysis_carterae.AAC.1
MHHGRLLCQSCVVTKLQGLRKGHPDAWASGGGARAADVLERNPAHALVQQQLDDHKSAKL